MSAYEGVDSDNNRSLHPSFWHDSTGSFMLDRKRYGIAADFIDHNSTLLHLQQGLRKGHMSVRPGVRYIDPPWSVTTLLEESSERRQATYHYLRSQC